MKKYKNMIERKNDLITRAEEIVNNAELEKRELTEDEAQELAEIRDDVKAIKDALGIMDEISDEREEVSGKEEPQAEEERSMETRAIEEAKQFDEYIRAMALNKRDDVNLTPSANGAVIPTTIANKIIETLYNICPILDRSSKYNVKGKLVIPFYGENASGAITVDYATEFVELESNVGSFDKIELAGFLAGALVKVSRSLINNSDFNLTDFIVRRTAYAFKRWIEGQLLKGTSGKITGLSTIGAGMTVTTTSATAITADELIAVQDKVLDDYQQDAIWIMSSATRTACRQLKNQQGFYLLNDDFTSPFGKTMLGKPVYVSDNMDDIGAGKTVIYYGDMSGLATKFAEEMEIQVLVEKFATQHAIGVVGWAEVDGKIENAQKISKLVMKAS